MQASTHSFLDRLRHAWQTSASLLCVGLDPLPDRLPQGISQSAAGALDFTKAIVDATAAHCCAFKPQAAHFAALGAEAECAELIRFIHDRYPNHVVILDAKRGDIGSTAARYAVEAFERYNADAVTLNPFLGFESVEPYFAYPDRGLILLCRTSNPGSAWSQLYPEEDPFYLRIARAAQEWNQHQQIGLVTGATYPSELSQVRAVAPELPFLVPGIGAQGGDIEKVVGAGATADGFGLLISASRSVIYASDGDDFAQAAAAEAAKLQSQIARAVAGLNRVA